MDSDNPELSLNITVSAAEWARVNRRILYLEATLVQIMRENQSLKEWFTAAELTGLGLPGLPQHKNAVTRLARSERWTTRSTPCQGGERHEYHFSSLPRRAFDALIERVLKGPSPAEVTPPKAPELPELPELAAAAPAPIPAPENAAPPWVLPLMRAIRSEAPMTVQEALDALPRYLPAGVRCPTPEEAAEVLRGLGMVS